MIYIKYNIQVALHSKSHSNIKSVILRVSTKGNRTDLYTRISVKGAQWDNRKQQIKHGYVVNNVPYNIINNALEEYKAFIRKFFDSCMMRNVQPSLTELKERFNRQFKSSEAQQSEEFFYLFDKFIEEKSKERSWGKSMIDTHIRLKNLLFEFKKDMTFADLSAVTMNKLLIYMSQQMYNDALGKRITILKSFAKWAQAQRYVVNEEIYAFNPKLPKCKKEVRYLTLEELYHICEMSLTGNSALERVRDIFVFQCYTALRYSDVKQLRHENIHYDSINEKYFIDLLTEKDDDRISIPLSQRATTIYMKYKDNAYEGNLVFPVVSNQKYNEHLKELGKCAGLQGYWIDYEYRLADRIIVRTPKANLTTHTARRTFIVTAINENIAPELIALITSHSDLKSMKPYLAKSDKGVQRVMDAINEADRRMMTEKNLSDE